MKAEDLIIQLKERVVAFTYVTSKGHVKNAIGTLNPNLIDGFIKGQKFDELQELAGQVITNNATMSVGKLNSSIDSLGDFLYLYSNPPEKKARKKSETTQAYYDLNAQGFRSFTIANLKSYV